MKFFHAKLPTRYRELTYASPYWVVRYPHQVRLRTARDAILAAAPKVLLDYGAGDGRVLLDAIDNGFAGRVLAYEPLELLWGQLLAEAAARGLSDRIELVTKRSDLEGPFDFIACLSVLEHLPLQERDAFYSLCREQLAVDGRVLIDVPIEVGPTLLVKNVARLLLKGRVKEYGWRELLRYSSGRTMYDPSRYDAADSRSFIYDHKGFDYRLLEQEVSAAGFRILHRKSTPLGWLPAPCLNQERFLTLSR